MGVNPRTVPIVGSSVPELAAAGRWAVYALASWLLALASRRLPAPLRGECAAEWAGELHAIAHDADRRWHRRTHCVLLYAGGLVLASGRLAPRSGTTRQSGPRRAIDKWPTAVAAVSANVIAAAKVIAAPNAANVVSVVSVVAVVAATALRRRLKR